MKLSRSVPRSAMHDRFNFPNAFGGLAARPSPEVSGRNTSFASLMDVHVLDTDLRGKMKELSDYVKH